MGITEAEMQAIFDACPVGGIVGGGPNFHLYKASEKGAWWVSKRRTFPEYEANGGWRFYAIDIILDFPSFKPKLDYLTPESKLDEYTWE